MWGVPGGQTIKASVRVMVAVSVSIPVGRTIKVRVRAMVPV